MNTWRVQHFGAEAGNPAIAGDAASPGGDGIPNLIKYALGLAPGEPAKNPLCTFGVDTNGFFALTYTRPDPPPPDIRYQVVASDDLATWCTNGSCVSGPGIVLNTNGTAAVTTETSVPVEVKGNQFLRLRVSRN